MTNTNLSDRCLTFLNAGSVAIAVLAKNPPDGENLGSLCCTVGPSWLGCRGWPLGSRTACKWTRCLSFCFFTRCSICTFIRWRFCTPPRTWTRKASACRTWNNWTTQPTTRRKRWGNRTKRVGPQAFELLREIRDQHSSSTGSQQLALFDPKSECENNVKINLLCFR